MFLMAHIGLSMPPLDESCDKKRKITKDGQINYGIDEIFGGVAALH